MAARLVEGRAGHCMYVRDSGRRNGPSWKPRSNAGAATVSRMWAAKYGNGNRRRRATVTAGLIIARGTRRVVVRKCRWYLMHAGQEMNR